MTLCENFEVLACAWASPGPVSQGYFSPNFDFSLFISLPNPPNNFFKEIENLLFDFVWHGKKDKIKRTKLMQSYEQDGLKMINIRAFVDCMKLMAQAPYYFSRWVDRDSKKSSTDRIRTSYVRQGKTFTDQTKYHESILRPCNRRTNTFFNTLPSDQQANTDRNYIVFRILRISEKHRNKSG